MIVLLEDSEQKIKGKGKLLSIGSVWIPDKEFLEMESAMLNLRLGLHCWGEIKYEHIDNLYAKVYAEVLNIFIKSKAKFNIITQLEPSINELKIWHGGDLKTAKMKMVYNLIFQNHGRYKNNFCQGEKLYLIADEPMLEKGSHKDNLMKIFSRMSVPISHATKCNSHLLNSLQLTDLLTGLVLAHTCSLGAISKPIKNKAKNLVNLLIKSAGPIDPITSGKYGHLAKINNWFYRPQLRYRIPF